MNYVLITGASAGLGKEFAQQLAALGYNLILVARREETLRKLATELNDKHRVAVEVVGTDLTSPDSANSLANQVASSGWQLDGLINNAGFGYRGKFHELPKSTIMNMIQLNVTTLTELTHLLLPNIQLGNSPFIINVASTAAFQAGPNMSIYYASKAFVLSFSEALHEELKDLGVKVSALCPGPIDTEFADIADIANTRLFSTGAMVAEDVAKLALANQKKAIVITGMKNKLGVMLGKVSPRSVNRKFAAWLQE